MESPVLSICIPTYNRAMYLTQCLESIVHQDDFEKIEVVISDNCSTDTTELVGLQYDRDYSNIYYYKNTENLMDDNFPTVLKLARGKCRKLTNDTVIYKPGAIHYMVEAVKHNLARQPQIYFLNSDEQEARPVCVDNLNDYLGNIGFHLTWIGSVSIWESDCAHLDVFRNNVDSKVAQVPFLIDNFERHGQAIIYKLHIMDTQSIKGKDLTYGLFKVFNCNFLSFIRPYVDSKKITSDCYEKIRKDMLFDFFLPWIERSEQKQDDYVFSEQEDLVKMVKEHYKNEEYYKAYLRKLMMFRLKRSIKRLIGKA